MNAEQLRSTLVTIRKLIDEAIGSEPQNKHRKRSTTKVTRSDSQLNSLPAHILQLRDEHFFKQAKTAAEVHKSLQSRYVCEVDRVSMALLRLQRVKKLRKASKATTKGNSIAYVW